MTFLGGKVHFKKFILEKNHISYGKYIDVAAQVEKYLRSDLVLFVS